MTDKADDSQGIKKQLNEIAQNWFLRGDSALFYGFCSHSLKENAEQTVPLRSGQMRIEYNPNLLLNNTHAENTDLLKNEVIRILMKHPYHRRPDPFEPDLALLASNLAIGAENPIPYGLPPNQSFEYYYYQLYKKAPEVIKTVAQALVLNSFSGNGNEAETNEEQQCKNQSEKNVYDSSLGGAGLWQEDALMEERINSLIDEMSSSNSWGSISGKIAESIKATLKIRIDYKKVLKNFRASVLSDKRKLTRLKPNRRTGFEYMGSKYDFTTKLLVAVDSSGSISDKSLNEFCSAINQIFKYGIKSIDLLFFDCELQGLPKEFNKAQKEFKVTGRGGTNFQAVFDYVAEHFYDGLIIFTDGYASPPTSKVSRSKIVWVCNTKDEWEKHNNWMSKTGRTCYMEEW